MASSCTRFMSRSSFSSIKSAFKSNTVKSAIGKSPTSSPSPSPSPSAPRFSSPSSPSLSSPRRFSSRTPSELGCAQSLLPLHSAVAVARMTSCLTTTSSCRALSQDGIDGT
ncbi:protein NONRESPONDING TO OXYLIPINS 2, mitochondrial-like isoform X2 [Euphorbia lathyris]|uniref:protein NONRESPONDING TO OXYLIPINS 2, mitochondrial-like isoform X2 n=1 Tax=Euphorbia lathyris TaxID=212925 RepID=UPI003313CF2C